MTNNPFWLGFVLGFSGAVLIVSVVLRIARKRLVALVAKDAAEMLLRERMQQIAAEQLAKVPAVRERL